MTSPETPIDAVHADERMLDQLAARSYAGHDELAVALGAWANNVDAEAATALHNVDLTELIRKHSATPGVYEMAQPPTTIRIRGSRLLATLGGAGVAAAALGIVLVNLPNLPGSEPLTPAGMSTSVFVDVVHLANAVKAEFEAKKITKAKAIQEITALTERVTDPGTKRQLVKVRVEVENATIDASITSTSRPAASSATSKLTKNSTTSELPSVMTTSSSPTAPVAPEQATSTQQPSTQPGSSSTLGSIPSDATSTPVPSSTPPSTGLPSTASPGTVSPSTASTSTGSSSTGTSTSSSSQRVKKPVNRKMPRRPSSTVTKGAAASASAPAAEASVLGASAAEASVR